MTASTLLLRFISDLHKDIRRDVTPWKPESIPAVMDLAKLYEEKYITEENLRERGLLIFLI